MDRVYCINCDTDFIPLGPLDNFCSGVCAEEYFTDLDFADLDLADPDFIIIVLELHI